ncbi:DUF1682 domain-containing protein [Pseudoscourfieldia marina]
MAEDWVGKPIRVEDITRGRVVPFSQLKHEKGPQVFQCLKLPSETALRAFSPKSYSRAIIIEGGVMTVCKCDEHGNVSFKYAKSAGDVKQTYFVDKKVLHQYDVHYEVKEQVDADRDNTPSKKSMFSGLFGKIGGRGEAQSRENDVFVFQPSEGGRFYEALRDARASEIYGNRSRGSDSAPPSSNGAPSTPTSSGPPSTQRRRFSDAYSEEISQAPQVRAPSANAAADDGFGALARRGSGPETPVVAGQYTQGSGGTSIGTNPFAQEPNPFAQQSFPQPPAQQPVMVEAQQPAMMAAQQPIPMPAAAAAEAAPPMMQMEQPPQMQPMQQQPQMQPMQQPPVNPANPFAAAPPPQAPPPMQEPQLI